MAVWSVGVSVADEQDDRSVTHLFLPGTLTVTHVQEFITAFLPLLDVCILGQIVGVTATFAATLPGGLKASPSPGAHVERGARFGWLTNLGNAASNRFATFSDGKMTGEEVNLADAAVISLRNAFTVGLTTASGLAAPTDSRGEDITTLSSARRQHKKER